LRRKTFLKELKMYKPKIPQDIIQKLYRLREKLAKRGIRKPITVLVREAIEEYLKKLKQI
jgi:rRNA-processing protein FCF1